MTSDRPSHPAILRVGRQGVGALVDHCAIRRRPSWLFQGCNCIHLRQDSIPSKPTSPYHLSLRPTLSSCPPSYSFRPYLRHSPPTSLPSVPEPLAIPPSHLVHQSPFYASSSRSHPFFRPSVRPTVLLPLVPLISAPPSVSLSIRPCLFLRRSLSLFNLSASCTPPFEKSVRIKRSSRV